MTKLQAQDKIRKLLQRNGRTEAEADTATILAAAIAEKHNIDIAQLDQADRERDQQITQQRFGEWAIIPDEAAFASLIIKRFFEVSCVERSGCFTSKLCVVGTEHHLTIARYVFDFLIGEFRRAWNRRPNKRIKKRKSFIHGCYVALFQKLLERFEQKPESPQLELALLVSWKAKRDKYIQENFGEVESIQVTPRNTRSAAAAHGYQAGQTIEIRPGVNGGKPAAGHLPGPTRLLGYK